MPHDLINAKPAAAAVREFFGSSQLSQFMDQTNPLSEITHKRRLSALGPGGLTRERAGFEVRDVHPTHYGRICPIETPEGPNIGLINSLATHARVNKYGFIESPYRRVTDGKPPSEVVYMSAMEEAKHVIAQANIADGRRASSPKTWSTAAINGEAQLLPRDEVDLMDVSPKQVVSVAAALIPFLENDDANRALMGSNMQRQAVPLIQSDAPLVGTGMEGTWSRVTPAPPSSPAAPASSSRSTAPGSSSAPRKRPTRPSRASTSTACSKFQRSNQNTCINQRPLVRVGDRIKAGDIIADGPSTELGELALGRNALVAFMPWNGYNFEDSILISERIVRDDVFTSIHIEEFEVMARDTKLGPEEITRDIPNVGEEALRNLDEAGIVAIGAEVMPGDILVGKVTPKGESPMTPEEKLLRAIFGEKASRRARHLPAPAAGRRPARSSKCACSTVTASTRTSARCRSRRAEIDRLGKDRDDEFAILDRNIYGRLRELLLGKTAVSGPKGLGRGEITADKLEQIQPGLWWQIALDDEKAMGELEAMKQQFDEARKRLDRRFEDKVDKLQRGDELPPGVMKMVKVFVAVKRKLQPGDKMAGRHGNKGVISKILPIEDMPYPGGRHPRRHRAEPAGRAFAHERRPDLRNPPGLGLRGPRQADRRTLWKPGERDGDKKALDRAPARHLRRGRGAAGERRGADRAGPQPVQGRADRHAGVRRRQHRRHRGPAGEGGPRLDTGQSYLYDGQTGEQFKRPVTVGYIYMLKLHHLVDDKIHARSIGPYSLVTQQPLGGKAQFGGQRFGEMEVWALEAYGAAYTLQEMLTVKSDDVAGRTKVYEAIVRGDDTFEAGIPESFNVLVKEMRSLGLNVELSRNSLKAAE